MARKRYTVEQIMKKLREAEVESGRGASVPDVCRKIGVSEQTYYRWRKEYGGCDIADLVGLFPDYFSILLSVVSKAPSVLQDHLLTPKGEGLLDDRIPVHRQNLLVVS